MDNIDYISASDGTGEAPRATVNVYRAPTVPILNVDSTENFPNKFVASAGTVDATTGLIDPATLMVFKGSKTSGTEITIDEVAPGYSDIETNVADVVVLKPTTLWADLVANGLASAKDSLGGDGTVKLVVSDTEPTPEAGKTIIWFEPL